MGLDSQSIVADFLMNTLRSNIICRHALTTILCSGRSVKFMRGVPLGDGLSPLTLYTACSRVHIAASFYIAPSLQMLP